MAGRLIALVLVVLLWCISCKTSAEDASATVSETDSKGTSAVTPPPGPQLSQPQGGRAPVVAAIPVLRDPFYIPPALFQQMSMSRAAPGPGNADNRPGNGYFRAQAGQLPRVKMRGIMRSSGSSDPIALLEVDGGEVYMVRENDEISLDGAVGNNAIRVIKIDRLSVLIEVGTLGERMILR